jgi:hypothetical protein
MRVMSREDQLRIVEEIITHLKFQDRQGETVTALKTIAGELRARMELPRSNALGELERAMRRLQETKTSLGYDQRQLAAVANVIVSKWPTVRLALENFGEESAE